MKVRKDGMSRPKTSCCALIRLRHAVPLVLACTAVHICCAVAAANSTVASCKGACKKKRTCINSKRSVYNVFQLTGFSHFVAHWLLVLSEGSIRHCHDNCMTHNILGPHMLLTQ